MISSTSIRLWGSNSTPSLKTDIGHGTEVCCRGHKCSDKSHFWDPDKCGEGRATWERPLVLEVEADASWPIYFSRLRNRKSSLVAWSMPTEHACVRLCLCMRTRVCDLNWIWKHESVLINRTIMSNWKYIVNKNC